MVGCCYFAPVASRVSPRRASYFFSAKPKKSNQKKGEPRPCRFAVPCATRKMEHPRSGFAASPSRGRHQRPGKAVSVVSLVGAALRGPRPGCLFAALTSRGLGLPHSSRLTAHKGTARRAPTPNPSPLTPHHGQPQGLPLHPHSYTLTPTPSLLTPHSSPLTPTPSLLTPHPSPAAPAESRCVPGLCP